MSSEFEKIAQRAVREAERVKCPLPDFRDGLKAMIEVLRERLEHANTECGDD